MSKKYNVAVFGATGSVGSEVISLLQERRFPVESLQVFSGPEENGTTIEFEGKTISIRRPCPGTLPGVDIIFSCIPEESAKTYAPDLAKQGSLVIDLSSAFRLDHTVPLVVPEINSSDIAPSLSLPNRRIIACPGGIAGPLSIALYPIKKQFGLSRVIVSTYQCASSAGKQALDELHQQTISLLNASDYKPQIFTEQLAFNVLAQVPPGDEFTQEGYSTEEQAITEETARLLGISDKAITATAVFVPTFVGHALAVHIDIEKDTSKEELSSLLRESPSLFMVEDEKGSFPTITQAASEDAIWVGRIRKSGPRSFWLWLAVDNLRKGSALGAVQIAEIAIRNLQSQSQLQ